MALSIDSENAKAVLAFEDKAGEAVDVPDGTVSQAASDNPSVLAVGAGTQATDADSGKTVMEFPLTPVAEGTANLSVSTTGPAGGPLTHVAEDGTVTQVPDPDPVAITVNPGAAAEEVFKVEDSGTSPEPAPAPTPDQPTPTPTPAPPAPAPEPDPNAPPAPPDAPPSA